MKQLYNYKLITETGIHEFITKKQAVDFIQVLKPFGDKYLLVETIECFETGKIVSLSTDMYGKESIEIGDNVSFLDTNARNKSKVLKK